MWIDALPHWRIPITCSHARFGMQPQAVGFRQPNLYQALPAGLTCNGKKELCRCYLPSQRTVQEQAVPAKQYALENNPSYNAKHTHRFCCARPSTRRTQTEGDWAVPCSVRGLLKQEQRTGSSGHPGTKQRIARNSLPQAAFCCISFLKPPHMFTFKTEAAVSPQTGAYPHPYLGNHSTDGTALMPPRAY